MGRDNSLALVGVDIGTTWIKAALWKDNGEVSISRRPAATDSVFQQDPERIWCTVAECVRRVLAEGSGGGGVRQVRVAGVGLSGHGPSLVALDGSGKPLSPVITWMDRRPLEEAAASSGGETGAAGPSFEATALWLVRQPWAKKTAPAAVLQPKDYICFRLTGELCFDSSAASCVSEASGSSVRRLFPRLVDPWETAGQVTAEAASQTGLPEGTPVASGGIDAFVETLGAGVITEGVACDSTGTSTCISTVPGTVCHVVPGTSLTVIPVSYTGGSLAWAMSVLFPAAVRASEGWEGVIAEALTRSRVGAGGLVFVPHMVGERSPRAIPGATGGFVGIRPRHGVHDMLRAVLEGCAYVVRECMEEAGLLWTTREIRAVGSGAHHDGWLQMKADITGVPVVKMAAREGAVLGAVILAGMAARRFASAAEGVDAVVRAARVFEPRRDDAEEYRKASDVFLSVERTLEGLWQRRGLSG